MPTIGSRAAMRMEPILSQPDTADEPDDALATRRVTRFDGSDPTCFTVEPAGAPGDALSIELPHADALRDAGITPGSVVELRAEEGERVARLWVTVEELERLAAEARRMLAAVAAEMSHG